MPSVPIVSQSAITLTAKQRARALRLAEQLLEAEPSLQLPEKYLPLVPPTLGEHPALVFEDLTGMPHPDKSRDNRFYQHRARLRAGDGDLVATTFPLPAGYEEYCRDQLGLGDATWLFPEVPKNGLHVSEACWKDDAVHETLVERARQQEVFYIHPGMSTHSSWELALLLSDASGRSIQMIAPPPALAEWVNDKVEFSRIVKRLLGEPYLPRRRSAWNYTALTLQVHELAEQTHKIGIKLPDSGGGQGIVTLEASELPLDDPQALQSMLKARLKELNWDGQDELLIENWETDTLASPSAQFWIPPPADGEPVMEGLFDQSLVHGTGMFDGCAPADLPDSARQEIIESCAQLAVMFQHLGYIGRCSFDMVLVGARLESSNVEFIECNGRWGGASTPMTLMNRLFGDWTRQPFVTKICPVDSQRFPDFGRLMSHLNGELYDRRTGKGHLLLSLPGRVEMRSSIDVLALGKTTAAAAKVVEERFGELAASSPGE